MNRPLGLIACLLAPGCASINKVPDFTITSFEQGLARPDGRGSLEIYEKGNDFELVVNGICTVAGEQKPCLRDAISFEYQSVRDSTVLACTTRFSEASDVVNISAKLGVQVEVFSRNTELKGRRGRVFWDGYTVPDGNAGVFRTWTRCTNDGIEVLTYQLTLTEQPNNSMHPTDRERSAGD